MAALALLAINSVANAGIVDPTMSFANLATDPAIMTVAPGGADSFVFPENYQIDVFVNDSGGNPVEILAADIWLEEPVAVWCAGGVIADSSTFAPDPGHTTFTGTPRGGVLLGGDCAGMSVNVIAVGNEIQDLNLRINSPDLNGDGTVSSADFAIFASFFQGQNFCTDYDESGGNPDTTVADFAIFASFFNISSCP
jgi:hypothetical protein